MELNNVTVFDPKPMMPPDDIFPKLTGMFDFAKDYWIITTEEKSKDYMTCHVTWCNELCDDVTGHTIAWDNHTGMLKRNF